MNRSHYKTLLAELDRRWHTTYDDLMECYGPCGYTRNGFAVAVLRLRRRGLIEPANAYGDIVKADRCPCCGRPMPRRQA